MLKLNVIYLTCMSLCFLWLDNPLANAQSCEVKLAQVIDAYKKGTIDKVVTENILESCLDDKSLKKEDRLKKEDKIEAYKYMTLIYLYVNDNAKAEESMIEFIKLQLKENPEYDPRDTRYIPETNIPEFLELYSQMQTSPIFFLGVRFGANFSQVQTTTNFSLDQSDIARGMYTPQLGYEFGLALELPFGGKKKSFSLLTELVLRQQSYLFEDELLNFANISFTENQIKLSLPVLLKYHFKRKEIKEIIEEDENGQEVSKKVSIRNKVQPFLMVGGSVDYLLSAKATAVRTDDLGEVGARQPINNDNTFDLLGFQQRNALQYGIILGGGFRFFNFLNTGSDFTIEARVYTGLNPQVVKENRGAINALIYRFGYIDSDFKLHHFSINLSYLIPKYNPKKIKRSNQLREPYQTKFE